MVHIIIILFLLNCGFRLDEGLIIIFIEQEQKSQDTLSMMTPILAAQNN